MKLYFEWDAEKARANLEKHGVSFQTAIKVFLDDDRIEIYDKKHSIDEDRYIAIGLVDEVLFVVYTVRSENVRLISARLANARERRTYYGNIL